MKTDNPSRSTKQADYKTVFGHVGATSPSGRYVFRNGQWIPIDQADRLRTRKADSVNIVSEATGIHPKQIPEFQEFFHEKGIDGVSFNPKTGECIYKDRPTKLRALAARQMYDKNEVSGGRSR